MVSVNVEAKKTVDVMIEKADELNIAVATLDNEVSKQENYTLKYVLVDLQMLEFQFQAIYLKNSHFLQ